MSTVDVVVPCRNYARFLRGCVESVLAQEGVEVRVLVIDDASSDESAGVAADLAAAHPRVEFRRHAVNQGHIATYNEGLLDWSTGKYAVLLSADDLLARGALRRATAIMDADETIGMVYGRAIYFEDVAPTGFRTRERAWRRWTGKEWLEGRCRTACNVISSPEVVVRGAVQRSIGGYCHRLPHTADLNMWLRVAAVSNIAYVRGVPQAFYRKHVASMSTRRTRLVDLLQRRDAFDAFFDAHRALKDGARLERLARRALARQALWSACRAYDRDQVEQARAADLVQFALETYPEADALSEYAALRRRQRLGAALCNRTQVFAGSAVLTRVRDWLWWRRWEREGV